MPKPMGRRGGGGGNWKNQWHDVYRGGESTRRVSFKSHRGDPKGDRNKDWASTIRAHLEEEDVDMGVQTGNARYNNKRFMKGGKRGRGSPIPGGMRNGKRKLMEGPINWYRVYLPYGNKYDKQFILQTLLDKITPTAFIPIMWNSNGASATFYVDDFKAAEKLNNLDREIQLPDGFKLIINVNTGAPNVDVNSALKDKMKLAMGKRYTAASKALDLSKFHLDPDLQDVFCALFKPIILLSVIEIISENIPELEALNLNENSLHILSHLRKMGQKLPNLKILYLGDNKDSVDLPPPISFDIEEVPIPPGKQTFLCNTEGQGIVRQFLEQYFILMDTENRQPLLQAYHENAMFSMTMAYPYGQHQKNSAWLNWYSVDNRNLSRITDTERRHKLLKQGHLQIVAFLQEMPKTKHDIHSFTVDLNLFTPQMLLVTITGIFRELKSSHKTPPMRYFFRTFVIIPSGSGFCIANEEIHITNATEEQSKTAFKTPTPAPVPPTPVTSPVAATQINAPIVPDDATKQQMIQAMSQESGMNAEWSQKCLQENNWDFQRAGFIFTEAKNKGIIPPEAFVK